MKISNIGSQAADGYTLTYNCGQGTTGTAASTAKLLPGQSVNEAFSCTFANNGQYDLSAEVATQGDVSTFNNKTSHTVFAVTPNESTPIRVGDFFAVKAQSGIYPTLMRYIHAEPDPNLVFEDMGTSPFEPLRTVTVSYTSSGAAGTPNGNIATLYTGSGSFTIFFAGQPASNPPKDFDIKVDMNGNGGLDVTS